MLYLGHCVVSISL